MTPQAQFRILDQQRFSPDQPVDSFDRLLALCGYETLADLENYFWEILPEDVGDVYIDDLGDSIAVLGAEVTMWCLAYPFSLTELDSYLFEFDERATIQIAFFSLREIDTSDGSGKPQLVTWLADFFRTTPDEFSEALGDQWYYLGRDLTISDGDGTYYLWTGSAILALNNVSAYMYRCTFDRIPGDIALVNDACELAGSRQDFWNEGAPNLAWLTKFVEEEKAQQAP